MQGKQFNNTVDMALYKITESISKDKLMCSNICRCFREENEQAFYYNMQNSNDWEKINAIIRKDLEYFEINLEYDFEVIHSKKPHSIFKSNHGSYFKCLDKALQQSGLYLKIKFPGKWEFVLAQIGPMFIISIIFILLITVSFIIALMNYLKERRLAENTRNFIDNMTHEFKTPLANISFANNRIKKDEKIMDSRRLKRYCEIIENESRKLNMQIDEFLKVSASTNRLEETPVNQTDIHAVIIKSLKSMEDQVTERGGNIKMELEATQFTIQGIEFHMMNAIDNILDNAMKYTVKPPEILVRTNSDNSHLYVTFTDNGIGISKEHLQNIFEKYYRVPTGNVHDVKGYGLGLPYVRIVVESAGGKIKVSSKPDKGTTIKISFPLSQIN